MSNAFNMFASLMKGIIDGKKNKEPPAIPQAPEMPAQQPTADDTRAAAVQRGGYGMLTPQERARMAAAIGYSQPAQGQQAPQRQPQQEQGGGGLWDFIASRLRNASGG